MRESGEGGVLCVCVCVCVCVYMHMGVVTMKELCPQRLDNNGKFVLSLMTDYNMILVNDDSRCIGTYTWSQDNRKSVIDYVLMNNTL